MTVTELLATLREQGVVLSVDHGQLRYRAPKGTLLPALRQDLQAHKAELLALLTALGSPEAQATRSSTVRGGSASWRCQLCQQEAAYCWEVRGKELNLCAACLEAHQHKSFAQLWQEIHQGKRVSHPWEDREYRVPLRWFDDDPEAASEQEGER